MSTKQITMHTLTNIDIIQHFIQRPIAVEGQLDQPGVIRVEGETYTLAAHDGVTEAEYTVKLDVGKKPKWVSLTQPGRTEPCRLGIYELKGDTLKVAMVGTKGKRARPKDFTGGPGVNVVTLKRAKGK